MNEFQTIFTFFFALYFAVSIQITGKMHPFDTASIFAKKPRALFRTIVSILILDIIPLGYFIFIFNRLRGFECNKIDLLSLLFLFFLSLTGFGIYRLHYGMMLLQMKGKYIFYDEELYWQNNGIPESLFEDLQKRPKLHSKACYHIIPGLSISIILFVTSIIFIF